MIQRIIGSMRKRARRIRYTGLWFVAIAGALCSTTCSHGGMLVPIPTEGSEILTTVVRNDTLQVSQDDVSIRVRGSWLDLNLTTSFRVEVKNSGGEQTTIDFGNARLTGNQGERAVLRAVYNNESGQLMSNGTRAASVGTGIQRTFELTFSFGLEAPDGKKTVVELRVPVRTGQGAAHTTELVFRFRYAKWPLPWSRR